MSIVISKKITGFKVVEKETTTPVVTPPAPLALPHQSIDRRIVIKPVQGLAERTIRAPKRPNSHVEPDEKGALHQGHPAWNSDFIRAPNGKFALSISSWRNGVGHPFEVFALGREAPTSTSEICQILSKVMAVDDPAFLAFHLEALKTAVETPFEIQLPYSGETITVGSVGAAIAHVVEAHAKAIGYLQDGPYDPSSSTMLASMTSLKEPKSEGQGGLGFVEDVKNGTTGDNFPLMLKEAVLPDGTVFPFSLWFFGRRTPAESEAICKLVSLALRHSDAWWTMQILSILREHRPGGNEDHSFWAPVPGTTKQSNYRSTWSYVAEVVIARLIAVGRVDTDGNAISQGLLFEPVVPVIESLTPVKAVVANPCPLCGEGMTKLDGCLTCVQGCGYSKCS